MREQVSFRLKPELKARLEILAKQENRSLSQCIETVLERYLATTVTLSKLLPESESPATESQAQDWRKLRGSLKGTLSTVDEFIQRKEEEKRLER